MCIENVLCRRLHEGYCSPTLICCFDHRTDQNSNQNSNIHNTKENSDHDKPIIGIDEREKNSFRKTIILSLTRSLNVDIV